MAFTRHGHQIPGTTISDDRPEKVARCSGPGLCRECSIDLARAHSKLAASRWGTPDVTIDNDQVLMKVMFALQKAGLTDIQVSDSITEMQNAGILFRERLP